MAPTAECRAVLRVLLAAAAISYLICVLIMSGMQKEDLDVSMLGKLQRYNVNIDDMNNEEHRKECMSRDKDFTAGKKDKNNDSHVSTTVKAATSIEDKLKGLNVAEVLNYLKSKQNSHMDNKARGKSIHQEMGTSATEYFENQPKTNMNLLQRYILVDSLNSSIYEVDSTYQTTNNYKVDQSIDIKIDEINPKSVKKNELMDKIFKHYLLQATTRATTTENTITTRTIDIQNVYKRIEELMASDSTADNVKEKTNQNLVKNVAENNKMIIPSTVFVKYQDQTTRDKENQIKSMYDFLTTIKRFKEYSNLAFPRNTTAYSMKDTNNLEKIIMTTTPKPIEYEETMSNAPELNTEIRQTNTLSPDLVKEIAETVKDVIIKDLRNELSNIYRKPVTTTTVITTITTETPPITTPKINTKQKELAIMDTFMELYEQIKTLKQSTFALEAHNKTEIINNGFIQELKTPDKYPPVFDHNELRKPKVQEPILSVDIYNTKHYPNLNPYHPNEKNRHIPITIQTNSVEIRPLAIPVSKPESLINQNIVVNSRHSFQTYQRPRLSIPMGNKYSNLRVLHRNRTHKSNKYSPIKRYEGRNVAYNPMHSAYQDLGHDDVIRFRMKNNGNSRIDTDYYEKINFGDYKNNDNRQSEDFGIPYVPRFHERLEKVDDRIAAISNKGIAKRLHSNDGVPERQQLSLVDMKKGASYDDTHFKNFLKTQQKVTDILERILATRPKTNTPRSVETT